MKHSNASELLDKVYECIIWMDRTKDTENIFALLPEIKKELEIDVVKSCGNCGANGYKCAYCKRNPREYPDLWEAE